MSGETMLYRLRRQHMNGYEPDYPEFYRIQEEKRLREAIEWLRSDSVLQAPGISEMDPDRISESLAGAIS